MLEDSARLSIRQPGLDRLPDIDLVGESVPGGAVREVFDQRLASGLMFRGSVMARKCPCRLALRKPVAAPTAMGPANARVQLQASRLPESPPARQRS